MQGQAHGPYNMVERQAFCCPCQDKSSSTILLDAIAEWERQEQLRLCEQQQQQHARMHVHTHTHAPSA